MRIAALLVLIAVCFGGYFMVTHYRAERQGTDGEVHWDEGQPTPEEKARFAKENSGDTPDGNSEHKDRTARQEAITSNTNSAVVAGEVSASVPTKPGATNATTTPAATPVAAPVKYETTAPTTSYASTMSSSAGSLPVSDSQSANATNNLHFGGSGHYEWYRQGNITYRVDPATGTTCVAFATLEEWRKQIVYSHGCGRGV